MKNLQNEIYYAWILVEWLKWVESDNLFRPRKGLQSRTTEMELSSICQLLMQDLVRNVKF